MPAKQKPKQLTDQEVVKLWRTEICERSREVDPQEDYIWEGVWVGFVIALGRRDLANYDKYMELGFPEEG